MRGGRRTATMPEQAGFPSIVMHELVGRIIVKGLRAAKARPCAIEVEDARLVAPCRPICAKFGVPVREVDELRSANDAFESLRKHFLAQRKG